MNSRFAAGVVNQLGFPELAVDTLKQLEDISVGYATAERPAL